jgi:hypothetical protein
MHRVIRAVVALLDDLQKPIDVPAVLEQNVAQELRGLFCTG